MIRMLLDGNRRFVVEVFEKIRSTSPTSAASRARPSCGPAAPTRGHQWTPSPRPTPGRSLRTAIFSRGRRAPCNPADRRPQGMKRDEWPPRRSPSLRFLHFREQDVPVLDLVPQQPIVEDDAVAEELRPAKLGEVGIHLVVAEVLAHIPGETATGIVAQRTVEFRHPLARPFPDELFRFFSATSAVQRARSSAMSNA